MSDRSFRHCPIFGEELNLIGRQDLQTEIEDVYRILLRIADEPDET